MEVGTPEMKGRLEIANNLTCYYLNINKLIVIAQAKKSVHCYSTVTLTNLEVQRRTRYCYSSVYEAIWS